MKGLIGKKLGMTQVYDENGALVPVTVIEAGPCPVLALRTAKADGYSAVQIGFGKRKLKNVSAAERGHAAKAGLQDNPPAEIREVRLTEDPGMAVGEVLKADIFAANELVDICGITKGRGFQGVVRRWGFGGGRETHGGAWTRRPGSIGMRAEPGKIYKGRRMPGQMGNVRRTVQGLRIVAVRPAENIIMVKGAVPGSKGCLVMVSEAIKKGSK